MFSKFMLTICISEFSETYCGNIILGILFHSKQIFPNDKIQNVKADTIIRNRIIFKHYFVSSNTSLYTSRICLMFQNCILCKISSSHRMSRKSHKVSPGMAQNKLQWATAAGRRPPAVDASWSATMRIDFIFLCLLKLIPSLSTCMYTYIYIYIHIYTHISLSLYIYIYI